MGFKLELLKPLLDNYSARHYDQGNIILYQGEVPRSVYIVQSGSVKVYSITVRGDEQVVTFQTPGEIFSTPWIFGKATSSLYYYEALTDCRLYSVDRTEFLDFIRKNKTLVEQLLDYYVTAYTGALIRISALEQSKASEKIMYTLYYLASRYSKNKNPDGTIEIETQLTHQQFASLIGLTRETTATEMSKLKKKGIIEYGRRNNQTRYAVHMDKLLESMGEESFSDLTF